MKGTDRNGQKQTETGSNGEKKIKRGETEKNWKKKNTKNLKKLDDTE